MIVVDRVGRDHRRIAQTIGSRIEHRVAAEAGGIARFGKGDAMLAAVIIAQADLIEASDPFLDDEMAGEGAYPAQIDLIRSGDDRLPDGGLRRIGSGLS